MGRAPCCDKANVKRGPWSPEEDAALKAYMERNAGAVANWISMPPKAGLRRCGKSCRLRWLNYLRPDIKHGFFTQEEDDVIFALYNTIGSRWSVIASHLPGRTDNDVKNYWNTKLKKKKKKNLILGSSATLQQTAALSNPSLPVKTEACSFTSTAAAAAAANFSAPQYNCFVLSEELDPRSSAANMMTTTSSGLVDVSPPITEDGSSSLTADDWSANYNVGADLFFSEFGSYSELLATGGFTKGLYHNVINYS